MPTVVIPFAGEAGNSRVRGSESARRRLSLAMLGDVLAAAAAVGAALVVVTPDAEAAAIARALGAEIVADPGGGQGLAVAAALADLEPGPILILNADVPCVVPDDLLALLAATPAGGIALVEALDGTTNALSLPSAEAFAPLYGPGSARRFLTRASELGLEAVVVALPNLAEDIDTLDDLHRLQPRCGPRTQACLVDVPVGATR
ncbi:MAG: cofC [Actinomycetia bacterium]|nr:cofC [Actinomycetes bacterium]